MRPPHAPTGDRDGIQAAIEREIGSEVSYKYPRNGDYRYPIVQYDIDGDSENEAIAFYRDKWDSIARIMILDKLDNGWGKILDVPGEASDIDRIMFYDFNNDGISEILIGWVGLSSNSNMLFVYEYKNPELSKIPFLNKAGIGDEELETDYIPYTESILCDLNREKSKELISIELNTALKSSIAHFWEYSDDGENSICLKSISSIELDGTVTGYRSCKIRSIERGIRAIFLESLNNNNTYSTELIIYNGETLKYEAPFYSAEMNFVNITNRPGRYESDDINRDGIVEIPTQALLPCYTEDSESKLYLTTWNKFDITADTKLSPVLSAVHNRIEGYYFQVPSEWVYNLTANNDSKNRILSFYKVDRTSGAQPMFSAELFRILVCKPSEWDKYEKLGYVELLSTDANIYSAFILQDSDVTIPLSYSILKNNFKLFNQQIV